MNLSLEKELAQKALSMREYSYVPYSGFSVGAALLTSSGIIYTGCNIENKSFSATVCAERAAIFKAVSDGIRTFSAVAVAGGKKGEEPADFCLPCAVCLQVMSEFCGSDFEILAVKSAEEIQHYRFADLLPVPFDSFGKE